MSTEYNINYDDQRFKDVEADKKAAVNEVEKTYGEMIGKTDEFYNAQINASKEWADKQTQLQQEKTDFAIEQIEQQKEQAKKDYTKEQQGAYVDWQKQKNDYGTNAEQQAKAGLASSGYAESSQVSYYNTYQNRVMTARESYNNAVLNYNNAIKDARLQNNSGLAEIAFEALQKQLEFSLAGFQYKNQLLLDKASKKTEMENIYYSRYQDVLSQINTENALAEQIRQHNDEMAFQREQFEWQKEQTKKKSSGGGGGYSGGGGGGGGGGNDTTPQVKNGEKGSTGSTSSTKVDLSSDIPIMASAKYVAGLVNSGSHSVVKTGKDSVAVVKTPKLLGAPKGRIEQYMKSAAYAAQAKHK